MKLGDTCDMKAGKAISSLLIEAKPTSTHKIKCFGGNGIRGYVESPNQEGEYPLIGRQGALCGNINFASGQFYATEHAVVVKPLGNWNIRFLYHLLNSMNLNQYKSRGAQPGLAVRTLEELIVPVPPIDVQNRIAIVLDRFDTLCTDLTSGLPAEIAVHQKQYEYYRDKLLTFKELA